MIAFSHNGDGNKTQTAGTLIQYLIMPSPDGKVKVIAISYTAGSTAHTLTLLRPIGRTKCSAVGASGQAVINLVADPGITTGFTQGAVPIVNTNGIAANDFLAIRETDGITRVYKVSSVSTLAITLTANLTTGVDTTSDVWDFGITTDTDPRTGNAHPNFAGTASVTTSLPVVLSPESVICGTHAVDEPVLFNSNNATVAGTLVALNWCRSVG